MIRRLCLAILPLVVSACAPVAPGDDAPVDDGVSAAAEPHNWTGYRAGGNEPFWQLIFGEVSMDFRDLGSEETASALIPELETTATGWRFAAASQGQPYIAEIERRSCQDSMSGQSFPHTVRVTANGRVFEGCGGDTASLLTGAEWRVTMLEGAATVATREPTINFGTDGRLTGNASCNRYTGPYEIAGDGGLTIGNAASTRMACAEPALNQQETRFLSLLATADRFDIASDGALRLYAADRVVIEARR